MSWGRARLGAALVACVVAISCAAVAWASASTQSAGALNSVIVVLRNQLHTTPDKRGYWAARDRDAGSTQAPLVAGVRAAGGRVTKQFQLLNAFVATVGPAELKRLRNDTDVSGVYPNVSIGPAPGASPPQPLAWEPNRSPASSPLLAAAGPSVGESASASSTPGVTPDTNPAPTGSTVCGTSSDPLLEPEALQLTHTAASANEAAGTYESSTGITGHGVTVAAIADGVDTTNPDLQRSGSPVVTEVDFGGPGSSAGTDGYEMFGDVSSIAAQGNTTYDISNPSISGIADNAGALGGSGSGCDIRVQGVAPGANVYALDAYPASGSTTEDLVAAINYAVNTAHASVINESFGSNLVPDDASDVIRAADQQAFAAGVTVVVSAGDSGPVDTVASPSSDPDVISVGASTQERAYTQAAIYGGGLASATPSAGFQGETAGSPDGWIDNSVASFSSGGVDEAGDVPDLIAPGEAGWALCSTNALYSGCGGLPLEQFQGTSESAPLVAGAAALVIQAYRNTHAGVSPGPALVKQILMSSADDIDAASDEQGAGLLDTDAAVLEAESPAVGTGGTVGAPSQTGILVSTSSNVATPDPSGAKPGQIDVSGTAGSTQSASVTVTNTGSQSEIVTPALRGLSDSSAPSTGQVILDGASGSTDSTYQNGHGDTFHYVKKTFTVPAGTDVLTALAAWPGGTSGSATVIVSLTDPSGRWAGSSVFWGSTDSAYAEVDQPEHGTWTAYFATDNGYDGVVNYSLTSSKFGSEGSVSPGSLTLAAGADGTFTVPLTMPAQAGDESENLNLSTALASAPGTTIATNVVPVALRSFVALGASGGTFSGVVDGGNGWNGTTGTGQVSTYDMNVPAGEPALVVDLDLPSDLGTNLSAFLIDPQGELVSAAFGNGGQELENVHLNPEAGTWQYVLEDGSVDDGTLTDGAYTGTVRFAVPDQITSSGVPDSTSTYVAPGSTVNATITFANHGPTTQQIFIDPRTDTYVQEPLYDLYSSGDSIALPNTSGNSVGVLVPNGTVALTATTQAIATGGGGLSGVGFDFDSGAGGGPDLGSSTSGSLGTSTSTIGVNPTLPEVAPGYWYLTPSMMQPYSPSPSGSLTAVVTATTLGFDTTVTTSTGGDSWLNALANYSAPATTPASIASNASANISVTFAPPVGTSAGTVVQGTLQVNDENDTNSQIGDVMAAIPYEYTVGTAPATVTATTTTQATTTPATTTTPITTKRSVPVRVKVGSPKVHGTGVRVPLSCPKTAQSACKVALKLTVVEKLKGGKVVAVAASAKPRARTRTIIIGSTTVTVAPGKSKTADVGLNEAGKQLLDRRHTLTALLTITQGATPLASRRVSFRTTGKG